MATYPDPDAFFDTSQVPWGSNDWNNPDPGKMDSIRKSLWGSNRFTGLAYDAATEAAAAAKGLRGDVIDVLRAPEFDVPGLQKKVDALTQAVSALTAAVAALSKPSA